MTLPQPSVTVFQTWSVSAPEDLTRLGPNALDDAERAHAASLTSASARSQYVSRRARLRDAMAALTGTRHQAITYWREPCASCGESHGRPRVVGFAGYVSTSSTPHVTALATHDAPVGIDVEEVAPLTIVRDIHPLLHPHERTAITTALDADPDEARRVFTQIWTRKEALLKATGEGLSAPLDRDDVSDPTTRPVPGWRIVDITDDVAGLDGPPTCGALATRRSRA